MPMKAHLSSLAGAFGTLMVWLFCCVPFAASAQTKPPIVIDLWVSQPKPLSEIIDRLAADFNNSQLRYRVVPTFKGNYPETLPMALEAAAAGKAPHILHAAEIATASLLMKPGVAKPVQQLLDETGVAIDVDDFLPVIRRYYSSRDGRLLAIPYLVGTGILIYNKDVFRKAGLDPRKPPRTWDAVRKAAAQIVAKRAAPCGLTTAWPGMLQVEHLAALHGIPYATRGNGFEGLDAELLLDSPLAVRHLSALVDWQREGLFKYGGRNFSGDDLFMSGECGMITSASSLMRRALHDARFDVGAGPLPYWRDQAGAPFNATIAGSAFWALTAPNRTAEEYRGVAEFFKFMTTPIRLAEYTATAWMLPTTRSSFEMTREMGWYEKYPYALIGVDQITRADAKKAQIHGIRLGNMPKIRGMVEEKMEAAFAGAVTPREALEQARLRGNQFLREFEREAR